MNFCSFMIHKNIILLIKQITLCNCFHFSVFIPFCIFYLSIAVFLKKFLCFAAHKKSGLNQFYV